MSLNYGFHYSHRGAEGAMCVNDLHPTRKSHALIILK